MNKTDVATFFRRAQKTVSKHSPEILTSIGIAGMVTTTVLAVKGTPKALRLLEEAEHEKGESLTVPETIKVCWKCYIPAAISGTVSIACIIGASSVNAKRNAALATAYKLSETALAEYRDKVVETIGEKKEKNIREKIDKDHIEQNPVSSNQVIVTKKGTTLCYDYWSKRYFESDIDLIKKAENKINKDIFCNVFGCASLNEFYDEINLERVETGDDVGWNVDNMLDIYFSAQLTEDEQPCIVISHTNPPKFGYDK